jgi:PAS domain S-box-containing protein
VPRRTLKQDRARATGNSEAHLFAHHPDPMWIHDCRTLRFLQVNNAAIATYGYSEAELLRMTLTDIRPAGDVPRLLDNIEQLPADGLHVAGRWRHLRKDGTIIHVDIRSRGLEFRGRRCELVAARDVSEQVRLEQDNAILARKERRARRVAQQTAATSRAIFEAAPDNFLVLRASDLAIEGISEVFLETMGASRSALLGRPVSEVLISHEAQDTQAAGALGQSLRQVRASGVTDVLAFQRLDIASASGNATARYWSVISTPVKGETGSVDFIILRLEEVTTLMRAQAHGGGKSRQQLEAQWRQLELDGRMRTKELERANDRLRQNERLLREAQELASMGLWEYDLRLDRITWSAQAYRMLGVAARADFEPTLEYFLSFVHPDDRDDVLRWRDVAIVSDQPVEAMHRIIRPDGAVRHIRQMALRHATTQGSVFSGFCQDVTELIEARAASEHLSRRLHETLDNINDAFLLIDGEDRIAFINHEAERILEVRAVDVLDLNLWEALPQHAGQRSRACYEEAVTKQRTVAFTEYYPPLDKWMAVKAYPSADGVAVLLQDVTASRAQQEQLRLLETAVAHLNDIVLITEAEPIGAPGPRIVYVNEAFEALTGFSREEALGQTPRILQGPDTQRAELDRVRAAMQRQEPVRAELINYRKQGASYWLDMEIVPIADASGHTTHFVAVERDITERKHAERALRESEERFRLVTRVTNDIVWDWNLETGHVWWNEAGNGERGYAMDPGTADTRSWTDYIHDADRERVVASIYWAIESDAATWREEYRFLRRDGDYARVVDRGFIIRDTAGKATRMLGSVVDVSEQRRLEEQLEQTHRLDAIGQLTGGVAHDFNNLLTVILGNAEMMASRCAHDAHLRQLAEMTKSAAERGSELTGRLLAFARRQRLHVTTIGPDRLVRDLEPLLRHTLDGHIGINLQLAPKLWSVRADAAQLENALLNLCLNARDAMPNGGCLRIVTDNVALEPSAMEQRDGVRPGPYVMIAVSDTGTGFTAESLKRAFEPFYTSKQVGHGSGLGLSMVYGFIKQSGGHVRIESLPQQGATVRLYLPRAQGEQDVTTTQPAATPAPGGNERILVVEDDALVREHARAVLAALGYDVICAADARAALDILTEREDIDLLFTDVVMPGGIDGGELARRAQQLRPELPTLFTSGYAQGGRLQSIIDRPGAQLLNKPYRRDELARKIRSALSGASAG